MLKKVIYNWERKLAQRDNNRVVRPFEWGLEFLNRDIFTSAKNRSNTSDSLPINTLSSGNTTPHANGSSKEDDRQITAPSNGKAALHADGYSKEDSKSQLQAI